MSILTSLHISMQIIYTQCPCPYPCLHACLHTWLHTCLYTRTDSFDSTMRLLAHHHRHVTHAQASVWTCAETCALACVSTRAGSRGNRLDESFQKKRGTVESQSQLWQNRLDENFQNGDGGHNSQYVTTTNMSEPPRRELSKRRWL